MKKRTRNVDGPGHVTPAGRSVFYDLGFDEAEARVLEMRADLMAALREHIEKRGWTQSEAAKKSRGHPAEDLGTYERRLAGFQCGYAARVGDAHGTSANVELGGLGRSHGRDPTFPDHDESRVESPPWHQLALRETAERLEAGYEPSLDWKAAKRELHRRAE